MTRFSANALVVPSATLVRWTTLVGSLVLTSLALAPGCKFTSCADTKSCGSEQNEANMGGQGGESGETPEMGMGGVQECARGEVECEGECVDPNASAVFCGASGSCEGDNAGAECASDEVCVDGACQLVCPDEQVECDGVCIDPKSEDAFCGADVQCAGYQECAESEQCIAGVCAGWGRARALDIGEGFEEKAPAAVRVGMDDSGVALAVWERMSSSSSRDLVTSRLFPAADVWSVPIVQDVYSASVTVNDLFLRSDGRAEVTYTQILPASGSPQMIWNVSRAQSGSWSPPSGLLTSGGLVGASARIHIDQDGDSLGAWIHGSADDNFVRFRYRPEGESWEEAVDLEIDVTAPVAISSLQIVPITESELGFVFRLNDDSGARVFWATGTNGKFEVAKELPFNLSGDVALLTAAGNGKGTIAVLVKDEESTESATIRLMVFRGGEWTVLPPVPTSKDALHSQLGVAVAGDGAVTLLWVESGSFVSLWSILLPSGDDAWQEPERIVGPAEAISDSSLATDGFGNVQAVWIQEASENFSVWGARRRAGETEWGTPLLLEGQEEDAVHLSLAFNNLGQGVATWWSKSPTDHLLGYNTFR